MAFPLEQDATQGQFLRKAYNSDLNIQSFSSPRLVTIQGVQHTRLFPHIWRENNWNYIFHMGISAM